MNNENSECISVLYNGKAVPLPDWAKAAFEIGAWARSAAIQGDSRLIVCCVVPCRAVFTSFIGLGAVASGGALFQKGFTWKDFLNLDSGTEIFWTEKGRKKRYSGIIELHQEINGQTLVPVTIRKGSTKNSGRWLFSELKFSDCIFSEEKLPLSSASEQFSRAESFFAAIGNTNVSTWLTTAGAEVRFVTNRAAFKRSLEGWELASGTDSRSSSIDQLMILRNEGDPSLAKARITNSVGSFLSDCPVSVLDGALAFQRFSDIEKGSLVVVLERSELMEEHTDWLVQVRSEHTSQFEHEVAELVPKNIPRSIEITGFCLKSS